MTMQVFDTNTLTKKESYKLMTGAIVPRPIAWVSTLSAEGVPNLAPFSFFNGVAVMPPTLGFTVAYADDARGIKDTYQNIVATEQCVVNIVTEMTAQAMNTTAKRYEPHQNEFELAGVTPLPAERVQPYRVAESPVHFECQLDQIVRLENDLGRSDLILCRILMIHIADDVYLGDYKIDQHALRSIGRMGGTDYTTTRDLFDMTRYHTVDDSSTS